MIIIIIVIIIILTIIIILIIVVMIIITTIILILESRAKPKAEVNARSVENVSWLQSVDPRVCRRI